MEKGVIGTTIPKKQAFSDTRGSRPATSHSHWFAGRLEQPPTWGRCLRQAPAFSGGANPAFCIGRPAMARHRLARGDVGRNLCCRVPSWWARRHPPGTKGRRPGNAKGMPDKVCTNLNRVQGRALVLFLPAFSRESRALPEAFQQRSRVCPRKKRNGTEVPFLYQAFSHTCSPAPQAGRSDGYRPRGRGRSCGGGPP